MTPVPGVALSRAEWRAFALAVVVAHLFYWRNVLYPSAFDAQNYLDIAIDMARTGLFGKFAFSEIRTYGYPLFARGLLPIAEGLRMPWGFVIFEAQLALHLAAALFLRRAMARGSSVTATTVFVALAVNPFALLYTADTLTESVSVSLMVVAAGCWAHLFASGSRAWLAVASGSFALGAAVIVRPASVFALAAWAVALAAVGTYARFGARRMLGLALVAISGAALPMLPQLANNVRHYGAWTPLVAASLGRDQQLWGIANLKYATALPPVEQPSVYYLNPFVKGRPVGKARPLAWYATHPDAGAATLALHTFAMLDPDLLFTYARTLDPWYRRPLGALTHAVIALAMLAAIALGLRARHHAGSRTLLVAIAALVTCHVALHATTAVEMRFGLPLLVLAGALAAGFVRDARSAKGATRIAIVAFVVMWVVASLALSEWIRAQSPQIRAWEARHQGVQAP